MSGDILPVQYLRSFVNHVSAAYNPCLNILSGMHVPKTQFFASAAWKHGLYKTQALEEAFNKNTSKIGHVALR